MKSVGALMSVGTGHSFKENPIKDETTLFDVRLRQNPVVGELDT